MIIHVFGKINAVPLKWGILNYFDICTAMKAVSPLIRSSTAWVFPRLNTIIVLIVVCCDQFSTSPIHTWAPSQPPPHTHTPFPSQYQAATSLSIKIVYQMSSLLLSCMSHGKVVIYYRNLYEFQNISTIVSIFVSSIRDDQMSMLWQVVVHADHLVKTGECFLQLGLLLVQHAYMHLDNKHKNYQMAQ